MFPPTLPPTFPASIKADTTNPLVASILKGIFFCSPLIEIKSPLLLVVDVSRYPPPPLITFIPVTDNKT